MLCLLFLVYCMASTTCSELRSRHKRSWIIDSFTVEEENPGPFPYELGMVNIKQDVLMHFELFGQGVDEEPKGVLSINGDTGMVYVHKALDYEERKMLKLKFEARKTDSSIDTKLGIEISILDINDNPPRFQKDLYEIEIAEGVAQGSDVLTVWAFDRDQRGTPNSTFHYEIKSVSPNPSDTEFFIDESGKISFKGCLDHEVAEKFTVLVEAKDHGEVVSLSSSTTVVIHVLDGNNHLPTISGQTGACKVKENEIGTSPVRLHVTDKDTPNSTAWRVKYTIEGDEAGHFKIETDPNTNDGILTVVKPLDFEEEVQRELRISVENLAPYFSCKVKEKTSSGLWEVDTNTNAGQPDSVKVLIEVEDINDPPAFSVSVNDVMLEENSPVGTWVEKVTAVDPDTRHSREFVFEVGSDPAGWVTVDPLTGDITTVKPLDRESPYVTDGVYSILLYAVDDGEPPLTGTATLNIHVNDQNDNVPRPTEDDLSVCVSDSLTTTNITAFDPDGTPFGGPFVFELLGDVKKKWTLDPSHGYTAGLVKEPGVYTGPHTLDLKISDMQGEFGIYKISVTVCDCSVTPECRSSRATATTAASGAIAIIFIALLLLLFLLLLAVRITCKKEFTSLQTGDCSGETLLTSNIETPGTDCKLPDSVLTVPTDKKQPVLSEKHSVFDGMQPGQVSTMNMEHYTVYTSEQHSYESRQKWNQTTKNSLLTSGCHGTRQIEDKSTMNFLYKTNSSYATDAALLALLQWRLSALWETEDLLDHQPHIYADEGDSDNISELESIIIPDDDSFQKALTDLGPKFKQLAFICKPPPNQN